MPRWDLELHPVGWTDGRRLDRGVIPRRSVSLWLCSGCVLGATLFRVKRTIPLSEGQAAPWISWTQVSSLCLGPRPNSTVRTKSALSLSDGARSLSCPTHACEHAHVHTYTHAHTCTHTCTRRHICTHVDTRTYMHRHTCAHVHTRVHRAQTHAQAHTGAHTCMHTHARTHICTHAHTHVHAHPHTLPGRPLKAAPA